MSDWRWYLATLLFVATARLPVCFPIGDLDPVGIRNSSKKWVNWYCPSSLFMVLPLLFLISIASLIHLLYLSSSVPSALWSIFISILLRAFSYPEWTFKKSKVKCMLSNLWKIQRRGKIEDRIRAWLYFLMWRGSLKGFQEFWNLMTLPQPVVHIIPSEINLFHPKDKRDQLNTTHAIYETPCRNCDLVYIGEQGETSALALRNINLKWRKLATK